MAHLFDSKLAISFYAVVSEGSVTAGARARGVAQPWMSEQIRKLERLLGRRLLVRTSRRLELTEEGRQFLPYAKALAEADEAAQAFVSELRLRHAATLSIGACQFATGIPERRRLVETLMARHPQLKMSVMMGNTADLLDGLVRGEFDIVIVHELGVVDRPEFEHILLAQRQGFLMVPEDDPLAQCTTIKLSQIVGRKLFVGPGNDDPRSMNRSLLPLFDAGVELVHCPDSERSFIEARALQHGGLCMYWSLDDRPKEAIGQRCVPIEGPPIHSPLALVRRAGEATPPVRWTWNVAAAYLESASTNVVQVQPTVRSAIS